jgi:hypothetical protein
MSEEKHPVSVVQRRRTSAQAKWLLNEAAALRDELARILAKQGGVRNSVCEAVY